MSENFESRLSSAQAKDAILKMHDVQSSADKINEAISKAIYNNLQSIPFANAQALAKDTWNKNYGVKIENNKITIQRQRILGGDQSKIMIPSSVVSGQKYILLANLEKIKILNPILTGLQILNYSQTIINLTLSSFISSGKKIIAIPFTATVNGPYIQVLGTPGSNINAIVGESDLVEFESAFIGVLDWSQELEDYWVNIANSWTQDNFNNLESIRALSAKVADKALNVDMPTSSFKAISKIADRSKGGLFTTSIVAYNSTNNTISNFVNTNNNTFNVGAQVNLETTPSARGWFGFDIQPSNYALEKKEYVLVIVGTGVFNNVSTFRYATAISGASIILAQDPADNETINIKNMVELSYEAGISNNGRYSYLSIGSRRTSGESSYNCSFSVFAIFEKVDGFTIDDYLIAYDKTIYIPSYLPKYAASKDYVENNIRSNLMGIGMQLNSNTFSPKYDIEMLLSGGQSLNVGGGAASGVNNFENTISFAGGSGLYNKPFSTVSEKNTFYGSGFTPLVKSGESYPPITASTTSILRLLEMENRVNISSFGSAIMPFAWGSSGTSITTQNKGSTAYANMIEVVTKAKEFALNEGKTFAVRAMNWYHGEADKTRTKQWYYDLLTQMFIDINTDIKAITGQIEDIQFFTYQTAGWSTREMGVQEAQIQAAKDYDNVHLAGAMYQFQYSDIFHPSDRAVVGLQTGIAIKRVIYDNLGWKNFLPISHQVVFSGTKYFIYLKFDVPVKPLRFDTTGGLWHNSRGKQPFYGFEVVSDGIEKQIEDPFITRGDTVVLITSENPVGMTIKYAVTGHQGGGNLCDSQNIVINNKNIDYSIDNFAASFSEYIITP